MSFKLSVLLEAEGLTYDSCMEVANDSIQPGICMMPECNHVVSSVEPDCAKGWCEECLNHSVSSLCDLLLFQGAAASGVVEIF